MTQRKINARDIIIQVEDSTEGEYLRIENLANVTVNSSENEEVAETSDFDSMGVYEQEIMQRGAALELEGMMLKDHLTGVLQPGRARVEEMCGEAKVGYDSLGKIRFRHPMDSQWKVWTCTFTLAEQGGETNDKTSWGATITKSGPTTLEDVA